MTLRLRYRTSSNVPVEVEGITPTAVRDKSVAEIQRLEIFQGNVKTSLAEFFDVSGEPADGRMEWEGDLSGVHWIGAGMTEGYVHVIGNAGRHVGSEMAGGEIHVEGDAGDWLGGEMHGGLIHVRGSAGHLVGAAYRGSARGMKGGTILIDGSAGNEIGHRMRRGLLAVGGSVADLAGFNMRAGTIVISGDSGIRHGAGMRRGTLIFLSENAPRLLPTFRRACRCRPTVLAPLFRQLRHLDFPLPGDVLDADFELYNGDMIEGGRGEVLIKA
ncbi:MAG: formylmethanofuran dehydrogenase subunit C [Planctomycetes bacterium]|nr:formylmethanofuran dehydrogenase subunit C [Planctomycetota bacterium]MBL7038713.1 formylmethanofuran dehydrogenase subunit C [Pirellulaceae bacterium]